MAGGSRRAAEARIAARRRLRVLGSDLRDARLSAGLSQRGVARMVGISHAQVGRIERAEVGDVTVARFAELGAVVGLDFGFRLYPGGDPVRDRAQLALLGRLRARLHPRLTWRTEVPLGIEGDRRAWDALIEADGRSCAVEAVTRLADVQALERRLNLKLRDGRRERAILLVAASRANRAAIALHPELREAYPLASRLALAALARGSVPDASAVVVL